MNISCYPKYQLRFTLQHNLLSHTRSNMHQAYMIQAQLTRAGFEPKFEPGELKSIKVEIRECHGQPWGFPGLPAPVPMETRTHSHGYGF